MTISKKGVKKAIKTKTNKKDKKRLDKLWRDTVKTNSNVWDNTETGPETGPDNEYSSVYLKPNIPPVLGNNGIWYSKSMNKDKKSLVEQQKDNETNAFENMLDRAAFNMWLIGNHEKAEKLLERLYIKQYGSKEYMKYLFHKEIAFMLIEKIFQDKLWIKKSKRKKAVYQSK